VLSLACEGADEAGGEGVEGEPGPREVLDAERKALADPERYPLRKGMRIEEEALRGVLMRLRGRHGPQVAVAYLATIEALPTMAMPSAPGFGEIGVFDLPDDPAARDVEAMNWLFDADVRQTAQRTLSTYLTLMMHQDLDLSAREIGVWMAFLRAAEPTLARCEAGAEDLWLCMDYGADVFVLEMVRTDPGFVVRRVRWMQATGS